MTNRTTNAPQGAFFVDMLHTRLTSFKYNDIKKIEYIYTKIL